MAYKAGKQVMELVKKGIKVSDIVTEKAFENAIMVHAAISGSTNSLLHIPAMAHELGIEIDADTFDRMHRGAHYLLDIRPAGKWPAQFFYYAGDQGTSPPGCDDRYRKDSGRKSGGLKEKRFL